jgi:hypothetical protein
MKILICIETIEFFILDLFLKGGWERDMKVLAANNSTVRWNRHDLSVMLVNSKVYAIDVVLCQELRIWHMIPSMKVILAP